MSHDERERRVLVLAPTGRDAFNAASILGKAAVPCRTCRDVEELCTEMRAGGGAVLITEEALAEQGRDRLSQSLAAQPPWSDMPFVVLTRGGPDSPAALRAMQTLGNVILLERPVRVSTCLTAVITALRVRDRQYATRQHLDDLHDSERRKDEFLAMLAHELRNPLAPIRNSVQLLKLPVADDTERRFAVDVIDRQVSNLSRLVDDLLDVSRITRGKVALLREPLAVDAVIARGIEISRPLIEAKLQRLVLDLAPQPLCVDGDLTRLAQVVSNLLNNAAKFTPEHGEIHLATRAEAGNVVIVVRDNGIGIPRHMLGKVFELFAQEDNSLARQHGGLGIGLTLVRKLVELHGGRVEAGSRGPGQGAEFSVHLPLCAEVLPAPDAGVAEAPAAPRRRILVVDDNVDAAESLGLLLRGEGHDVRTAHGAAEALAVVPSFRPEVCVLDIGLPLMDGYELARRIRRKQPEAPLLVALSGYGRSAGHERRGDPAFDHFLVKPLRIEALEALMSPARGARDAAPLQAQARSAVSS